MEWTAAYVGLPYLRLGRDRSGVDCWGLARLPVVEIKGLPIPLWDTVGPEDGAALGEVVETGRHDGSWLSIDPNAAREFDFVRMRAPVEIGGRTVWRPVHIGLVGPRRQVLHIQRNETSQLQPIEALRNRITEFCRHRGLQ
ncbi:hypothetical protein [Taklimakanibacter deserti]|uniref:hypothetical protein n=1 Tax=Taklimakanibacter deserti TaxID=2267839 RepID=UPI000E657E93